MAADGQSQTSAGMIQDTEKVKVIRLDDGRLLGHTGYAYDIRPLAKWLNDGAKLEEVPKFNADCFGAILLELDGTLTSLGHDGRACPSALPAAIGSGEEIAMGAMLAGASAKRAVEIACQLDMRSGGKITELRLEGEP